MEEYHIIKAKKMGWTEDYVEFSFPVSKYSKDDVIAEFKEVKGETLKANNRWYEYTAYEFNGNRYHHYFYRGIAKKQELLDAGWTEEEIWQD